MVFDKFIILYTSRDFFECYTTYNMSLLLYLFYKTTIDNIFIGHTLMAIFSPTTYNYMTMILCLIYKFFVEEFEVVSTNMFRYFILSDILYLYLKKEKYHVFISTITLLMCIPLIYLSQNPTLTFSYVSVTHALRLP